MIKRQYNNNIFKIDHFIISVQFNGFTASGKNKYRIGIIDTTNTDYPHEIVYTTTSHESEKTEAARVLETYRETIKKGRENRNK